MASFAFGTYVKCTGRVYGDYIGIVRKTLESDDGEDCWLEVVFPREKAHYDWYPAHQLVKLNLLEILAVESVEP